MKKINILILTLLLALTSACTDEGGGVLVTQDQPTNTSPPPPQGPFGGPIDNDESIPDPSPYLPPYTSDQLDALIQAVPSGGTLELDRSANLTFSVSINKPLTIITSPSLTRPVLIKSTNGSSVFNVNTNDFAIRNVNFEMVNTFDFITSAMIDGTPTVSNFSLEKSIVKLRGLSSFNISMNGILISKSTILGLSTARQSNLNMSKFVGNNLTLLANNFIDVFDSYSNSILLFKNDGVLIQENVVRCYCEKFLAAVSANEVKNMTIRGNLLHDRNENKSNSNLGNVDVGSLAISFQLSDNISDEGFANLYAAQIFRLDDEEEGGSFNINLSPGLSINPFPNTELFNYLPSEDFTPICELGGNPTISTVSKPSWSSYFSTRFGQTLYYSGAIKPACL